MNKLIALLLLFPGMLLAQTKVNPNQITTGTYSGNMTATGNNTFSGQNSITEYNFSGIRVLDNNKFTTVAGVQTDCSTNPCPFFMTPLYSPLAVFSPLRAQDFLIHYMTPAGKYGPMVIFGDLPPSNGAPTGYPPQSSGCGGSTCDTGIDLQYTNFAASRYFNLTGTTINTNYAPHFEFYYFTGNPTSGAGNKQIVNYYNAVETSRTTGDLANVSDLKLGNNYIAIRAPSFTGTTEGIENDVFYRAAGTISGIQFATETICGIPDNITANITNTSYCNPTQWDNAGSGAVGQAVLNDARLSITMTGSGTSAGVVGYCAFCVQTTNTGGTYTSSILGFDRVGPTTLPTFSAGKYWFASVNQTGSATGANVNNDWWQGGDYNSGHLTFGGNGGSTGSHLWSASDGQLHWLSGSAPGSSTAGNAIPGISSTAPSATQIVCFVSTSPMVLGHCTGSISGTPPTCTCA